MYSLRAGNRSKAHKTRFRPHRRAYRHQNLIFMVLNPNSLQGGGCLGGVVLR